MAINNFGINGEILLLETDNLENGQNMFVIGKLFLFFTCIWRILFEFLVEMIDFYHTFPGMDSDSKNFDHKTASQLKNESWRKTWFLV